MNRRILVTGGSGYIGSVLVNKLARDYSVHVLDGMYFGDHISQLPGVTVFRGDVRNTVLLEKAMEGVTHVIILAAIAIDPLVELNPALSLEVNERAVDATCRIAREHGVRRIVYASSSSIYGSQPPEVAVIEEVTPQPQTLYAETKLHGEVIINSYAGNGLTVTSIRSATVGGPSPRMRFDTIANLFSKQAYYDRNLTVHGGQQHRSHIHINDITDLYCFMLDAPAEIINGKAYNAVAGNMTVRDLALIAASMANSSVTVEVNERVVDNRSYTLDGSRLKRELDWEPVCTVQDIIRDNFAFFTRGAIPCPDDSIYYNIRHMKSYVEAPDNARAL